MTRAQSRPALVLSVVALATACVAKGAGGSNPPDTGAGATAGASSAGNGGASGDLGTSGADAGVDGAAAGSAGSSGSGGSGGSGDAGTSGAGASSGTSGTGGDAGSGGADGGTAVDPSKLLTALTPDEQTALCQQIVDFLNTPDVLGKQHEIDCRSAGFYATAGSMPTMEAAARSMCQSIYDGCMAGEGATTLANCGAVDPSCTATAGELLACWYTTPDQLTLAIAQLPTCATLTLADLAMTSHPSPPPSAACQTFNQKCPGVMMAPPGL